MTRKKTHQRQYQKPFPVVPVIIGAALVIFGALSFSSQNSSTSTASSSSVTPVEVNFVAPELSLQNINSETETLTDYRSDVVLVNNWATWCPPCKAEMPTLSAYYNEHHKDGFTIIAIEAGDPQGVVAQFAESYGLKFPVWLDPSGAALKAFGNPNLPNSYVIDRSGTVRYAWTGEINKAMLEQYVTPLIVE